MAKALLATVTMILLHVAHGANVHISNGGGTTVCSKYWVPPPAGAGGGCRELPPGAAWDVPAAPATSWQGATFWAVPGGCAGQACNSGPSSGFSQFQLTLQGYGNNDFYGLSSAAGFNAHVSVEPTNAACAALSCQAPDACVASPPDTCPAGSTDYNIIFSV